MAVRDDSQQTNHRKRGGGKIKKGRRQGAASIKYFRCTQLRTNASGTAEGEERRRKGF